jgi:general secretion pathway protein M
VRRWWEARAPRERVIIAVLTALVGVVLYLWLAISTERGRAQLRPRVTELRAQAARVDQGALEIQRLRAAPPPTASQADLRTLVQAQVDAAGLGRALTRIDVQDRNHVQAVFGAVPFAGWLGWAAGLQAQHVRLDTARIEALSTPGIVSVSATFARAAPR